MRGNQYLPAREPGSGVGDQIAYRPVVVVEVELFDFSDFPIVAVQFVSLE
jgi:hypothetical protein